MKPETEIGIDINLLMLRLVKYYNSIMPTKYVNILAELIK
nr:MAG TPA: hypothetical protein [Caudoviricetes sp.]